MGTGQMNAYLQAARRYIAAGWAVFPCRPGTKRPDTKRGCLDASTDPDQITAWWTEQPNANIGLACGSISGVVVADGDVKAGQPGLETLQRAGLTTWHVATPSGGVHVYCRPPREQVDNSTSSVTGVDVKTDHGYVLAPPSHTVADGKRTVEGTYRWLGDLEERIADGDLSWLEDFPAELGKKRPTPRPAGQPPAQQRPFDPKLAALPEVERTLGARTRAVATSQRGGRHGTILNASIVLGSLVGAGALRRSDVEDKLYAAACVCGYVDDYGREDAQRCITDGLDYGAADPCDLTEIVGGWGVAAAPTQQPQPSSHGVVLLKASAQNFLEEIRARSDGKSLLTPTPIDGLNALLGGGFQPGGVTLIPAPPGRGKTSFAIQCGLYAAKKKHTDEPQRPVLFWSLEMPAMDVWSRVVCLEDKNISWRDVRNGDKKSNAVERASMVVDALGDIPFAVLDNDVLTSVDDLERVIVDCVSEYGLPPLVIIDYLQLVARPTRTRDRLDSADDAGLKLQRISRKHACPIIAISSTSRASYNIVDPKTNKPNIDAALASARDSGTLEFHAAAVISIAMVARLDEHSQIGWLVVGKSRYGGRTGAAAIRYNGLSGTFYDEDEGNLEVDDEEKLHLISLTVRDVVARTACRTKSDLWKQHGGNRTRVFKAIDLAVDTGLIARPNGTNNCFSVSPER